jgi:hypothetical protein
MFANLFANRKTAETYDLNGRLKKFVKQIFSIELEAESVEGRFGNLWLRMENLGLSL